MIAADDDRRLDPTLTHQLVDAQAEARAVAVAKPENPRRQALERDALARERQPTNQCGVVPEHLERRFVGEADVFGIARERRPTEGAFAFAEQRTDVFGDESRDVER